MTAYVIFIRDRINDADEMAKYGPKPQQRAGTTR